MEIGKEEKQIVIEPLVEPLPDAKPTPAPEPEREREVEPERVKEPALT